MKKLTNIKQQAHELFMRYGIRSVTMDVLSSGLGVSKKTLYARISDKDELIDAVIELDLELIREGLDEIHRRNLDALPEFLEIDRWLYELRKGFSPAFYFDLKRYYPQAFLRWTTARRALFYESILLNLGKGKKQEHYRREIDTKIIASLYVARFEMLESGDLINTRLSHTGDFADELLNYHLRGICNARVMDFFPISLFKDKKQAL